MATAMWLIVLPAATISSADRIFFRPAFYLDKLGLRVLGAKSLDELSFGLSGPSSCGGAWSYVAVLLGVALFFAGGQVAACEAEDRKKEREERN